MAEIQKKGVENLETCMQNEQVVCKAFYKVKDCNKKLRIRKVKGKAVYKYLVKYTCITNLFFSLPVVGVLRLPRIFG